MCFRRFCLSFSTILEHVDFFFSSSRVCVNYIEYYVRVHIRVCVCECVCMRLPVIIGMTNASNVCIVKCGVCWSYDGSYDIYDVFNWIHNLQAQHTHSRAQSSFFFFFHFFCSRSPLFCSSLPSISIDLLRWVYSVQLFFRCVGSIIMFARYCSHCPRWSFNQLIVCWFSHYHCGSHVWRGLLVTI